MKRIFIAFLFLLALMLNCSHDGNDNPTKKKVIITGVAAIGASLPAGSSVEIRGVPVTKAVMSTGATVEVRGAPIVSSGSSTPGSNTDILIPSEIVTTTVEDNGVYTADVSNLSSPYLIRVFDQAGGQWYYSATTEDIGIANVNPLTSALIKGWYDYYNNKIINDSAESPIEKNISGIFSDGFYSFPNGTTMVFPMPDMNVVGNVKNTFMNMVKSVYNVIDTEDIMIGSWQIGMGWDQLLDNFITDNSFNNFLRIQTNYLFNNPNNIINGFASCDRRTDISPPNDYIRFHCEVWAENTTIVILNYRDNFGNNHYVDMILSDTQNGIQHYIYNVTIDNDPEEFLKRMPHFGGDGYNSNTIVVYLNSVDIKNESILMIKTIPIL